VTAVVEMPLANVGVPGGDVEIGGNGVVVPVVAPTQGHPTLGRDELARLGVGANGVYLLLLIGTPGVGYESPVVEHQAGIAGLVVEGIWLQALYVWLQYAVVQGVVQGIEAAVAVLQPVLELSARVAVEGLVGIFVVDLPNRSRRGRGRKRSARRVAIFRQKVR